MIRLTALVATTAACLLMFHAACVAEEEPAEKDKDRSVKLAEGKIEMTAPDAWERQEPRFRIIEAEFSAPAAEGDDAPARITMMGAFGSVEQNIDRWIGQFSQPDGAASREKAAVKEREIAGQKVHTVDIAGTYKDQAGPSAPATLREDYRMIGAIIEVEKGGTYYVKMYGPKKTVAANEKGMMSLLESLRVKD